MKKLTLNQKIIISIVCVIVGSVMLFLLGKRHARQLKMQRLFLNSQNAATHEDTENLEFKDTEHVVDLMAKNDTPPDEDPYQPSPKPRRKT